jgi:hypothetical protein
MAVAMSRWLGVARVLYDTVARRSRFHLRTWRSLLGTQLTFETAESSSIMISVALVHTQGCAGQLCLNTCLNISSFEALGTVERFFSCPKVGFRKEGCDWEGCGVQLHSSSLSLQLGCCWDHFCLWAAADCKDRQPRGGPVAAHQRQPRGGPVTDHFSVAPEAAPWQVELGQGVSLFLSMLLRAKMFELGY